MDKTTAVRMFESLASGARLDVYRLLVQQGPEGMVAGAIAQAVGIAPTTLSFHLKAMSHAGLVTVEPQGRYLRYRANRPNMLAMVAFLTEECCGGHPELCLDVAERCAPAEPAMATAKRNRKA
jgi:ArsR family transcriptional regulator